VKIALAQINPTVGDFRGNTAKILEFTRRARQGGADLALFPELAICGYPPADLLEKPAFVRRGGEALDEIAEATAGDGIAVVTGYVTPAAPGSGKHVMNSAALLRRGQVEFIQSKMLLPFYDVFDEQRYFAPAPRQRVCELGDTRVALTICEDAWNDKSFWENRLYQVDPVEELMKQGAGLILNISASPWWRGKRALRREMLAAIAMRHRVPVAMVNQVGGDDSLIFDGSSLVIGPDGEVIAQAKSFEEDLVFADLEARTGDRRPEDQDEAAAMLEALTLGTRDYVRKCGFSKAVVGLSGGIDSALVAAIAVRALGPENVTTLGMPSPYSSQGSVDDSRIQPFARRSFRRSGARYYRRKRAVAHSRRAAHGLLQQVQCAGAHHWEQERNVHRVLYPVWRHGGSAGRHRRCLQNAGLRHLPRRERGKRSDPPQHSREAALGRAAARANGYGHAASV